MGNYIKFGKAMWQCVQKNHNHQQHQKGIVLITSLMLLLVMSLMAFSALENTQLSSKTGTFLLQHDRNFQIAETTLRNAEKLLKNNGNTWRPNCRYTQHDHNYFAKQTAAWWLSNATCSIPNSLSSRRYVIEKLIDTPCAIIHTETKNNTENGTGSSYFRMTVRTASNTGNSPVILQSTYALPDDNINQCPQTPRLVSAGRQSWREIY